MKMVIVALEYKIERSCLNVIELDNSNSIIVINSIVPERDLNTHD